MDPLIVRPYRPSDWPRLTAIHDAARMQELRLAGLEDAFLPLETAAERENLFGYTLQIAELAGEPAAFIAYTESEVAWLYVDPAFMRRGIGARLVRYMLDHTAARPVTLEVLAGNNPALALYRSQGFAEVETVTGSMPGNERLPVTVHVLSYGGASSLQHENGCRQRAGGQFFIRILLIKK